MRASIRGAVGVWLGFGMRHEDEVGKVVYIRYLCDLVSLCSLVSFHVNIN